VFCQDARTSPAWQVESPSRYDRERAVASVSEPACPAIATAGTSAAALGLLQQHSWRGTRARGVDRGHARLTTRVPAANGALSLQQKIRDCLAQFGGCGFRPAVIFPSLLGHDPLEKPGHFSGFHPRGGLQQPQQIDFSLDERRPDHRSRARWMRGFPMRKRLLAARHNAQRRCPSLPRIYAVGIEGRPAA